MSRATATIVLAAVATYAARADAGTQSCPSVTSPPGIVRATVGGRRSPVGEVVITYSLAERSVCANFTANPKTANAIEPDTICYDVSIYGRLSQRGTSAPTATLLDGSRQKLRLDHESQLKMSADYVAYADDCSRRSPDAGY